VRGPCSRNRIGHENRAGACTFSGLSDSYVASRRSCILERRGTVMSDFLDFIQSYWYELGSLIFQFAILAVIVSFGRRALRILAAPLVASSVASQAQVELLQDLQKLSETHVSRPAAQPESYVSRPVAEPETHVYGGVGRVLSAMPGAPAESHAEPAASSVSVASRREGPSLWKAAVTWLKTPMGGYHAVPSRRQVS
jgi:hypothetical protein